VNRQLQKLAIPGLRWSLGLVVLWQSVQFAFGASAMRSFAKTGLPQWIRPALGGTEILAAILFLLPAARIVGGYALLAIFLLAAMIHMLHGWYNIGALLVYGMAVLVCMTQRKQPAMEVAVER
jgi:DoxX-like family